MYFSACFVSVLRHGLNIKISIIAEKNNRQAVIPSGPNTGKRYLAIEALPCTEIIEIKINKTGQNLLSINNYLKLKLLYMKLMTKSFRKLCV
jgi:hypothetical protein